MWTSLRLQSAGTAALAARGGRIMTNIQLGKIRERLIEENDRHRKNELENANARAGAYAHGVEDTLVAIAACADEQDGEEEKPRTNLDRIRAMSAEEMANRIISLDLACEFCPVTTPCFAQKQGGSECRQHIVEWLNSPAKDVVDG